MRVDLKSTLDLTDDVVDALRAVAQTTEDEAPHGNSECGFCDYVTVSQEAGHDGPRTARCHVRVVTTALLRR